ncbi:MAG: peptidoglycan DD-metalloendopeptidase family protein [Scytonema sp. PMC 1069.18]|nr:peptidoglycan DD-metalloendopeptidase family protein [Scytonema sp. PMC 1069.18]MEC4886700.1 peptidoglycan DD-metalloendopeptidase family protein [Scytonema sp. PMC 1070.18]
MKRALKKKEKAELEKSTSDDVPVEQINAINPRGNYRSVPTKAAMIGLAISMGATSLLVTRQSDQARAAEPVENQNTASTIPSVSENEVSFAPKTLLASQAISKVSIPENPVVIEPTAIAQVAELRAKWQGVASGGSAQASTPVENSNSAQAIAQQSISSHKTSIQQSISTGEVKTLSKANGLASNETIPFTVEAQTAEAEDTIEPKVNAQLKAQQEFALNQLQEKSNRLRRSLKEYRSAETNDSPAVATQKEEQPITVAQAQPISTENTVAIGQSDTSSNASREELLSKLKHRMDKPNVAKSIPIPTPTATAVVTSTAVATYQVKPGDTLADIAGDYGISVSKLVEVNNLNNPDRLRINQRLTIPVAENSNTDSQTNVAFNQSSFISNSTAEVTQTDANDLVANSSNIALPNPELNADEPVRKNAGAIISSAIAQNKNFIVPTPEIVTDKPIQKNRVPEISINSAIAQNRNLAVPTPFVTSQLIETQTKSTPVDSEDTALTTGSALGVGGDTPVPSVFTELKEAQRADKTGRNLKKNQRLRSLQAEIERLREKYRAQQSGNVVLTEVSETDDAPRAVPVSDRQEQAVQISVPTTEDRAVPIAVPRSADRAIPIAVPKPMTTNANRQPIKPGFRANPRQTNEPINPELLPNQTVATPSRGVGASEALGRMRGTQVSPQLPPLAAVDRYLPKPIDETLSSTGYMWPAKGVLTSGYGPRWGRMHRGIDIANATGTPIFAASAGVVERAGWNNGGYGYLVDVRHPDGSMTRYGHNSRLLVQPGQSVEQGQQISAMGSTGFSTGPHLHFEVHPTGKGAVNPIAFLPKERI